MHKVNVLREKMELALKLSFKLDFYCLPQETSIDVLKTFSC